MNIVTALQPFSFSYPSFDESSSLFVGFSVYNITTGTAVFAQFIEGNLSSIGSYCGAFIPQIGQSYLVIGVVYTDNTYGTVDPTRSPTCDIWQAPIQFVTNLFFTYGAFDQNPSLYVRGSVYDLSSGTPVFQSNEIMAYVAFGVYLGAYVGVFGHTYQVPQAVYTNNTYANLDSTRAPACANFDCIYLTQSNFYFNQAILTGQNLNAILIEA